MKFYLYEDRKDIYIGAYFPKDTTAGEGRLLPAVLICPGGGYQLVGTTEGRPVADKFNDCGYAAFILNYRFGDEAVFDDRGWEGFAPAIDLKAALTLLHEKAADFGIDPASIVLAGFSAGGHLCFGPSFSGMLAEAGLLPKAIILTYSMGGGYDSGGEGRPQPDFDISQMKYADDPAVKSLPVFMWHAKDDAMVPLAVSERLDARLTAESIPHTFLVYEHGVHTRPFADTDWFYKAIDWLKTI